MNIAIIPARYGSKRIPQKNIKEFCGKPIIAWVIEALIKSQYFDDVIVSTDSDEIKTIAEKYGAKVPFMRSSDLASDNAPTIPVVQDAIEKMQLHTGLVVCVYPTSVFVTPEMLKMGMDALHLHQADFVMPVVPYSCPFERALQISTEGQLYMKNMGYLNQRTQDCEQLYHDVGQFYLGTVEAWRSPGQFYDKKVWPLVLKKNSAYDIDTLEDWEMAEMIFSFRELEQKL